MNEVQLVLDAVAVALAVVLALIGFAAAYRYRDWRFSFVGIALSVLALIGGVGLVALLLPGSIPGGGLGTVPVLLLITSEVLLYLSFVASRSWTSPAPKP
jgi:hypothetical protein